MSFRSKQRQPRIACLALASILLAGGDCDSDGGVQVPALVDFQVQPVAVTMAVGDTVQVRAIPINDEGEVHDTASEGGWSGVYWNSTVREVATVLDAMPGNPAKVIAVSPGQSDICPNALGVQGDCAAVTVEARSSLK